MGNNPSGARLHEPATRTGSNNPCQDSGITVRIVNQTGLELHRTSVEPPDAELESSLLGSLGAVETLTFPNLSRTVAIFVVYKAAVLHGTSNRAEQDVVVQKKSGGSKKVATSMDLRDTRTDQYLYLFITANNSNWYLGSLGGPAMSVAFGTGTHDWNSMKQAARPNGLDGCCSWNIEQSHSSEDEPLLAHVELKKTDNKVVLRRQALLDAVEARGRDASGGGCSKLCFNPTLAGKHLRMTSNCLTIWHSDPGVRKLYGVAFCQGSLPRFRMGETYFELRVDRTFQACRDGLGLGITLSVPLVQPMLADELGDAWLLGYDGHSSTPSEKDSPISWKPEGLQVGDRVGLLVNARREVWVVVNGSLIDKAPTPIPSESRQLFGVVDLVGRTAAVSLIPDARPPPLANITPASRNADVAAGVVQSANREDIALALPNQNDEGHADISNDREQVVGSASTASSKTCVIAGSAEHLPEQSTSGPLSLGTAACKTVDNEACAKSGVDEITSHTDSAPNVGANVRSSSLINRTPDASTVTAHPLGPRDHLNSDLPSQAVATVENTENKGFDESCVDNQMSVSYVTSACNAGPQMHTCSASASERVSKDPLESPATEIPLKKNESNGVQVLRPVDDIVISNDIPGVDANTSIDANTRKFAQDAAPHAGESAAPGQEEACGVVASEASNLNISSSDPGGNFEASSERLALRICAWPPAQSAVFRRLLQNVVGAPEEPKFRTLPLRNARVTELLESAPGAWETLQSLGWVTDGSALVLPKSVDIKLIEQTLGHADLVSAKRQTATPKTTRSGTLALQNQAALERRRQEERDAAEQKRRDEIARKEFEATYSHIVAAQDLEFQQSLLHDQLKDLTRESEELSTQIARRREALEEAGQRLQNAELRLARYGENPRTRAEAEAASKAKTDAGVGLEELEMRLDDITVAVVEKQELLALAGLATVDD